MSEPQTVKVRYEFIHFRCIDEKPKTSVWSCRNNKSGQELGIVKWHGPWRRYCYFSTTNAVYSDGCLADIQAFIARAEAQRKFFREQEADATELANPLRARVVARGDEEDV